MEIDIEATLSLHELVERVDRRLEERDSEALVLREQEQETLKQEKYIVAAIQGTLALLLSIHEFLWEMYYLGCTLPLLFVILYFYIWK